MKYKPSIAMKIYNIIFSNKLSPRITRHVIFWATFYIYQVVRMSFLFPSEHLWDSLTIILITGFVWGVIHNVFITYSTTYYLVPKFFNKKKYVSFIIGIVILFIIIFTYNFIFTLIVKKFTHAIGATKEQPYLF